MRLLKRIKNKKLNKELERGYEVLKKKELIALEECELLAKMRDIYEE